MAKYIIKCEIEGLYGDAQPGEYSLSWNSIAKKTLVSRVLDFPNEIRKNEIIRLTKKGGEISELVADTHHDLKKGCTILDLCKKKAKSSESEAEAKKEFDRLVREYSFIEKL